MLITVFNSSKTSHRLHVGVAVGGLVNVGLGDDEEDLLDHMSALAHGYISLLSVHLPDMTYVLGSPEGDTGDALNLLQAELGNGLARLLLVARVDSDGRASWDGSLSGLSLRVGAVLGLLNIDLLLLLVGEFFNSWVGHVD